MKNGSPLRKQDEEMTDIVNGFLDEMFYARKCENFERVNDRERQVVGIDTIFDFNGNHYACDEKAAIRYINKNLKTFAFELSFLNRSGCLTDGWLLSDKKVNNSFLLVWIDKAKKDIIESSDDIEVAQLCLVRRDAILEHLDSLGWSIENLSRKDMEIRSGEDCCLGDIYKDHVKFSYSRKLFEKPINVLLPREKLVEISDFSEFLEKK